jgi:hypothetical protein
MSSSLKNDLLGLKNRLEEIESDIENRTAEVQVRKEKWDLLESEVKKVINLNRNKNLITLNIGGKKFTTFKETLLSCKHSVFERLIEMNHLNCENEFFIDRSPKYFAILFEYIRSGNIDYTQYKDEELKLLREEAEYYNIINICQYLEDRLKDVEFVDFDYRGPYVYNGKTAGTNYVEDIIEKDMMKGICTETNGWIIIELNNEWDFNEIEIGGWKGNPNLWYPANGAGAKIETSKDKKTWKYVGNIPSSFGNELATVKLTRSTGRYIKFTHNSYLGIGYLRIKKTQ